MEKAVPSALPSTEYGVGDLRKKSKPELLDLLDRQRKLLSNTRFIAKLPDKGQKIRNLKDQIELALCHLNDVDRMTNAFHKLKVNMHTGKNLDSDDDDSDDPTQDAGIYETLATNGILLKQYRDLRQKSAASDQTFLGTKNNNINSLSHVATTYQDGEEPISLDQDKFTDKLTKKVEAVDSNAKLDRFRENRALHETQPKFITSKTTRPDKQWYESSITPPPSRFTEVKIISLQESYSLITEQTQKAKELAFKQATEQLVNNVYTERMDQNSFAQFMGYWEVCSEDNSEEED